jgi:hypothetical protein
VGVSTALMDRAEVVRANAVLGAKAPTEAVKAKVQAKTNFMVYVLEDTISTEESENGNRE